MKTIFLLLLLTSCMERGPLEFEAPEIQTSDNVTFQNLSADILQTKCLSCHADFSDEENLRKYIDHDDPEKTRLFGVLRDGSMPMDAPPLTTLELEMVRTYIQHQEAPAVVSFEELKEKILVPKCLQCHKKMGEEENLQKWVDVNSPLNSKLYVRTLDGSMPKNGTPLSSAEMKLIRAYLQGK